MNTETESQRELAHTTATRKDTMNDRTTLNSLITEYQTLAAADRDETAPRRWEIRAEVGTLSHLMGPGEQTAWLNTLNGEHETRGEADAQADLERRIGEQAIEDLAHGRQVGPGEMSFVPTDWRQRVADRSREIRAETDRTDAVIDKIARGSKLEAHEYADLPANWSTRMYQRQAEIKTEIEADRATNPERYREVDDAIREYTNLKADDLDETAARRWELRDTVERHWQQLTFEEQSQWLELGGRDLTESRAEETLLEAVDLFANSPNALTETHLASVQQYQQQKHEDNILHNPQYTLIPNGDIDVGSWRRDAERDDEQHQDEESVDAAVAAKAATEAADALAAQSEQASKDRTRQTDRDAEAQQCTGRNNGDGLDACL